MLKDFEFVIHKKGLRTKFCLYKENQEAHQTEFELHQSVQEPAKKTYLIPRASKVQAEATKRRH